LAEEKSYEINDKWKRTNTEEESYCFFHLKFRKGLCCPNLFIIVNYFQKKRGCASNWYAICREGTFGIKLHKCDWIGRCYKGKNWIFPKGKKKTKMTQTLGLYSFSDALGGWTLEGMDIDIVNRTHRHRQGRVRRRRRRSGHSFKPGEESQIGGKHFCSFPYSPVCL
jgi:hypothetical protein